MGVNDLWSILEPVRESVPLYSLSGQTLAVDLSMWVCEAQHVQAMMGKVTKPHLRNLFFRVSALTQMGIKLVFVIEGEAPKLKAETISKRIESRFEKFKRAAPNSAATKHTSSTSRGRLKVLLRECAEMLDYMGVPWVTAAGEAEAMCAYLDSQGLVDGCITNDGDAFLYGAQTVYRNFNMNTKDPQVDCYRTSRVQTELRLSRENLVGLAILLGCDYIPKGIPGVGKEQALRLIHALTVQSLLQRFHWWKEEDVGVPERVVKKVPHCHVCHHPGSAKAHERCGCVLCNSKRFCEPQDFDYQCPCDWHCYERTHQASSCEARIRKKTLASEHFPFTEIINEFLVTKDKHVSNFRWRKPNMMLMQNFAYEKMEWPKHYTSEKVLVLMTYTELMNRKCGKGSPSLIKPLRIFKPRVRNAVPCFEVIWSTPENYVFPDGQPAESQTEVTTVEKESLFSLAYPEIVELFLKNKALAEESNNKKKTSKSKKKSCDPCDDVSDLVSQMTLQLSTQANIETQTQMRFPAILSPDKTDIFVLESSGPHKQHLNPREIHHSLRDCSNSQVEEVESPISSSSCGSVTGSEVMASPSVSTIIDALHLSSIDWDALSFTSSPPPQAAADRTAGPKLNAGNAMRQPALELCHTECPLRDRVLMRNAVKSVNQTETENDAFTKQLSFEPAFPKPISSHNSKPSGQIAVKGCNDTKSLETQHVGDRKALKHKDQNVTATKADQALHIPKQHVVPVAQAQSEAKVNRNYPQKPDQKYKFVKTSISSTLVPPLRCHSDPCKSEKDRMGLKTTKKSVCVSVCSSSEDSDAENQEFGAQRREKVKLNRQPPPSLRTDFSLKPTSILPIAKETLNLTHEFQLGPKHLCSSVDVGVNLNLASTQGKRHYPLSVKDDVFVPTPDSPVTILDSDDSVICSDSPLPLAERLRLKFL
ncbi:flap endonuclease GEN homolog 1 [Lampris incognitus]|uniref:flap endonuclease GEN homolog 1 n=1 Tax=Lampris incognitus TaxID=2546036 RepID=UPI0024B548B8|nr:flap endonuclease GEN homolog 1 [Lampris incognitus]